VQAIESTKASVIQSSAKFYEETRLNGSLSYQNSPQNAKTDPCRSLLKAKLISPSMPRREYANSDYRRSVGSTATPVALGLFLGVRVALGPKDVINPTKRLQIGPEIRADDNRGNSHALAIAAYRSCKNNHVLGLQKTKQKSDVNE
jgi:hypothetical protein